MKMLEKKIKNMFSILMYNGKNIEIIPNAKVTRIDVINIISRLLEESLNPLVTTSLSVRNKAAIIGKIKI